MLPARFECTPFPHILMASSKTCAFSSSVAFCFFPFPCPLLTSASWSPVFMIVSSQHRALSQARSARYAGVTRLTAFVARG